MENNLQGKIQLWKKQPTLFVSLWQICQSGEDVLSGEVL